MHQHEWTQRLSHLVINQKEKDHYHMWNDKWNLKKKVIQMNLFTKQKQTHRHRKQKYGYQRGKELQER